MNDIAVRQSRFSALANPTRFLQLSGRVQPYVYAAAIACIAVGLGLGFAAPDDYPVSYTHLTLPTTPYV